MVSKVYVVNECPKMIIDEKDKSVENNNKMQNNDQMTKVDRYILHISNEMVSQFNPNETTKEELRKEERLMCNRRIIKDPFARSFHNKK